MSRSYNTLPTAQKILNEFRDKYHKTVEDCRSDIRPDWDETGITGYSYKGIEDKDRHFIYQAIGTLGPELRSVLFDFDVSGHFITPEKAVEYLKVRLALIKSELEGLQELRTKYSNNGGTPYPIAVSIEYHQKTVDILGIVLKLDEVQDVLNPGYVESLEEENISMKFEKHWRKELRKYGWQLFTFLIFLAAVVLLLIYRASYTWVGIIAGIIPIANSFITKTPIKESFRAFFGSKLKEEKFNLFKEAKFANKLTI